MSKKVGYLREIESDRLWLTEAGWSLNRAGIPLAHSIRTEVHLGPEGRPEGFTTIQFDGTQERKLHGEIKGGTVRLQSIMSGTTTERNADLPAGTILGSEFQLRLRDKIKDRTIGTEDTWRVFMEDNGLVVTLTTAPRSGTQMLTLDGQLIPTRTVDATYHGLGISSVLYFEWPSGELVKQDTNFSGMSLLMTRTSKEAALRSEEGRDAPDILLSFRVPIDRPLRRDPTPTSAAIKIIHRGGAMMDFPSEGGQSFNGKSMTLLLNQVKSRNWKAQRFAQLDGMEAFSKPTEFEQSEDAEIQAVAKKVVGSQKNAWSAVKSLTEWVHQHITDKGYAVGFASAKEVLQQRRGDCTEHAVLLGALCKAAGIPTRTVVGLIGQGEWFLYHMWVECYVGEWIPVDAAFNQAPADLWHIKYRHGLLNEEGFFSMGVAMLPLLNNIELKLLK